MIAAIVVNYRTKPHVVALIDCLRREDAVREVVLVDNSPEPELEHLASAEGVPVRVVSNARNAGLAGAFNQGAALAEQPYLLMINPDVRPFPGSVTRLYEQAHAWQADLAGPRFYWDEARSFRLHPAEGLSLLWQQAMAVATSRVTEGRLLSSYWQTRHDRFWEASEPFPEPFLSGACLLIRRAAFEGPGLLDERFFLYCEETDLCFRARRNGKRVLCVPQAEMVHFWNASPAPDTDKVELHRRAVAAFMRKHYPGVTIPDVPRGTDAADAAAWMDCGNAARAPVLNVPEAPGALGVELAANRLFIPFAECRVEPGTDFTMPPQLWQCLPPGPYCLRVRSRQIGPVNHWRFTKPA